jgi:hypothetical protein
MIQDGHSDVVGTAPRPRNAAESRAGTVVTGPVPLQVLAVGTDDWAIEQTAASIERAGHDVMRCHEPDEPSFPCNALRPGRRCPLDIGVDAVVTSRARPTDLPAAGETGVTCALHAGKPLIVTGISRNSPFNSLATQVVGQNGDLVEAIEAAAADPDREVISLTQVSDR